MSHKRVVVMRGGPSAEYAVSMQTGAQVLQALRQLGYSPRDIVVSRQGEWLEHGRVYDPSVALSTADVAFIAMHGAYGEDGTIQRLCERLHVPFTGSGSFASSTAFNKHLTKQVIAGSPVVVPRHVTLSREDATRLADIMESIADYADGYVIKPISSGSSHGVEIVLDVDALAQYLQARLAADEPIMVEERIVGKEATCGILDAFRGEEFYALPVIEIVPPAAATHFDHLAKYNGTTQEICPGRFSYAEKSLIAEAARSVHKQLGLQHYSRSDFIVRDGQAYFLEVNTLPGLTAESLFPKAADAVGLSFPQLVQHLVDTARVA